MRDAELLGDIARILDVAPRAAGAGAMRRGAMIIELKGDADHLVAGARQQSRNDRRINAAGHRDNHACLLCRLGNVQSVQSHSHLAGIQGSGNDPLHKPFGTNVPVLRARTGRICPVAVMQEAASPLRAKKIQ